MKVRVYVDGQRVSGHRAGKSRAGLLIGAAVLLLECPLDTTSAQAQSAGVVKRRPSRKEWSAMGHLADLEEIMHFDPEEGIADLDRHLDRLSEAATFAKRRPVTARLLLSPTGAMAIEVKGA